MAKETKCNNGYCPLKESCETFSYDGDRYELVEKQFDVDDDDAQEPFSCDAFEDLIDEFN